MPNREPSSQAEPKQGGDDLDDDFVPDELVALSADEGEEAGWEVDEEDAPGAFASEDEGRPRVEGKQSEYDEAKVDKKRKRREKERQRKAKKRKTTGSFEIDETSLAMKPPRELAGYLSTMQAKSYSTMSSLELEDMSISEDWIVDTTVWTESRSLVQFPEFIANLVPTLHTRLGQKSKTNGAPTLIFIAEAALRVVEVTRALKDGKLRGDKGGEVAKLFARHFKLQDHVSYLKRTKVGAAVGTPGRIGKLLEAEALSLSALSHILLDVTFRDAKKRSLLDVPECRDEVFRGVLGFPPLRQAIKEGRVKLVLF